jgi:hypothetical protein
MPNTTKYIYRIIHYKNLEFILRNGLYSCNSPKKDPEFINIGHSNLIEKRGDKKIIIGEKEYGTLNDYIPFYFAPRSPMLYTINKGNVHNFTGTQNDIIYLVSTIEKVKELNIPFVFTDGHALQAISNFYNDTLNIDKIDWDIMKAIYWNKTNIDNDRRRRRMAEFLVLNYISVSCILGIAVINEDMSNKVNAIQKECNTSIKTIIKKDWYY